MVLENNMWVWFRRGGLILNCSTLSCPVADQIRSDQISVSKQSGSAVQVGGRCWLVLDSLAVDAFSKERNLRSSPPGKRRQVGSPTQVPR